MVDTNRVTLYESLCIQHARETARKEGRFYLERKQLNRQGYDSAGRYYGTGRPLYVAWCPGSGEHFEVRADSRAEAKALVSAQFKGARFYR